MPDGVAADRQFLTKDFSLLLGGLSGTSTFGMSETAPEMPSVAFPIHAGYLVKCSIGTTRYR